MKHMDASNGPDKKLCSAVQGLPKKVQFIQEKKIQIRLQEEEEAEEDYVDQ